MDKLVIAYLISRSPYRARIEINLKNLFGETDIMKIDHPDLNIFLKDVLPKLSPSTFKEGRDETRR